MTEKNIKSRITHKHDTEANWQLAVNFIPKQGEIIVYDVDENYSYSRFKIGDGILNVNDLPFSGEGEKIYKQGEEPVDAEEGALWIDTDVEAGIIETYVEFDNTLSIEGAVADAKAVGDAIEALRQEILGGAW